MEDVPNTTEGIRTRFEELKAVYDGGLKLHVAAEYMIDSLFEERLEQRDLLEHGDEVVLVETSAIAPPMNLWTVLERMLKSGYRPLIAHPERYRYMDPEDYRELHNMGCLLQMNLSGYRPLIAHPERYRYMDPEDYRELHNMGCLLQMNLPSIIGFYGETARQRALYLLDKGWYRMVGSDCHRFKAIKAQYTAKELKKDTIAKLSLLMDGVED